MRARLPVHRCADLVMVSPRGPKGVCGVSETPPAVSRFRPGIGNPSKALGPGLESRGAVWISDPLL